MIYVFSDKVKEKCVKTRLFWNIKQVFNNYYFLFRFYTTPDTRLFNKIISRNFLCWHPFLYMVKYLSLSKKKNSIFAGVAELADALDSGSNECKFMWVQVPFSAPKIERPLLWLLYFLINMGLEPERVWALRKQSGGLFLARSGRRVPKYVGFGSPSG